VVNHCLLPGQPSGPKPYDKQQFAFVVSGELIGANRAHSVKVDLQLEERKPPETLYHGTVERCLPSILEAGL